MTDGIMDVQGDLLKQAIKGATDHIHTMFKDKKPFRKEKVDPRQSVLEFETMPDDVRNFAIQNHPEQYAQLEQQINKMKKRMGVQNG